MAPSVAIVMGVMVPLISLLLLACFLCGCLRHLHDPERNLAQTGWVGLCSLAEEQQSSDGNHNLTPLFCIS